MRAAMMAHSFFSQIKRFAPVVGPAIAPALANISFLMVGISFALAVGAVGYIGSDVLRRVEAFGSDRADTAQWAINKIDGDLLLFQNTLLLARSAPQIGLDPLRQRFATLNGQITDDLGVKVLTTAVPIPQTGAAVRGLQAWAAETRPLMDGPDGLLRANLAQLYLRTEALHDTTHAIAKKANTAFAEQTRNERREITNSLQNIAYLTLALIADLLLLSVGVFRLYRRSESQSDQIKSTTARLETMVTASFDAILALDDAGRTLAFNPAAERIFGYDAASVMDRCAADFLVPDDVRDTHPLVRITAGRGMDQPPIKRGRLRTRALRRSGESFAAEFSIDLAPSPAGAVWVIFARDISDSIAREQQLKQARDTALAGDRAKARFLAVMSHEIRTPLNGLLGSLDLLADTNLSPEQARHLTVLQASGQLLMQHVNDVLDLSQVESGRLQLELVPVDLQQLMEDLVDGQLPVARAGGNRLDFRILGPAPDLVEADPRRIGQIVLNLLSNALKFTRGGSIRVELEQLPASPDQATDQQLFEIRVADTGQGISDADQERIFEDFVTLDTSYGRKAGGTGLGLGIARNMARLMGGDIDLQSEPGEGSLFSLRLPLHSAKPRAPRKTARPGDSADMLPQNLADLFTSANLPSLYILVIEANEISRNVLCAMLKKAGHRPAEAEDGLIGMQMAAETRYDLIFTDISMPRLDGMAATKLIRNGGLSRHAIIIAVTAHAMPEEIDRFKQAQIDDFLLKPVRISSLQQCLLRHFQAQPQAAAPAPALPPGLLDPETAHQLRDLLTIEEYGETLDQFEAEMGTLIDAIQNPDTTGLQSKVHHAAGSAATFGALALRQTLSHLEAALKSGDAAAQHMAMQALPALWQDTVPHLALPKTLET